VAPVGFVDAANDNYALLPTSPYYGAASDGTNIGADIDSLNSYTANVLTGVWTSCADISTPVNEAQATLLLSLAPNPATDHITLRTNGGMTGGLITVLDAAGRAVLQHPVNGPRTDVAISALPNGLFLIQLTNMDGLLLGAERLMVVR
jgi:hypothetical protein